MLEKIEKFQVLIVGIIVVVSLLIATVIVTSAISRDEIKVTGSASEIVKSDSGSLEFEISVKEPNRQLAYDRMQKNLSIVKKYLSDKNIKNIEIKPVNGYYNYKRDTRTGYDTNIIENYNMSQPVKISADDVEIIKDISIDISSLVNQGVEVNVFSPSYNYSKLSDLKVSLLEKASVDAKNRAKAMLKPTHNRINKITSVRMGVYQITPVDSTDVSDGGINDTSTIYKKVTAVANVSFKIK
ncbi:SIMPL domain-containing protein [bacterium]|nr:SIMPL domain-containing protein [bacterium]